MVVEERGSGAAGERTGAAGAAMPPGMAVLWRTQERPPRPGRRPALSLDQIAAAGVALADADGLAAVSMARVAERLGMTTMALYRYLGSKDELLALMYDAALAPPDLPASGHWRESLEAWCTAQLDAVAAHPWLVAVAGIPHLGPNRLRWMEAGLAALEGTGLPAPLQVGLVGTLSLHVLTEGQLLAAYAETQAGRAVDHPALLDYGTLLRAIADPVTHPRVVAAVESGAFDDGATPDAPDDDAGVEGLALTLILDGVESLVRRYAARADAGDTGADGPGAARAHSDEGPSGAS